MGFNLKDASTYKPDLSQSGQGYAYTKVNTSSDVSDDVDAIKAAFPTAGVIDGFIPAGHFSEDGWSEEFDVGSSTLNVYGGLAAVVTRDTFSDSLVVPLASLADPDIKGIIWGIENVEERPEGEGVSAAIIAYHSGSNTEERFWVIKTMLNDGRKQWIVVPRGVISSIGNIEYTDGDISSCELTITALPYAGDRTAFDMTEPLPAQG